MDNQDTINLADVSKEETKGFLRNNRVLLLIIAVFVVIIIAMIPIVINVLSQNDDYVKVEYTMEGYDGPISDSTVAFIFSENVANKLVSDDNYSLDDAVKNYEKAYNEVDDSLKFDLGLSFSEFLYSEVGDTERAIAVLRDTKQYIDEEMLDSLYYENAWINMCDAVDDLDVEECKNLSND